MNAQTNTRSILKQLRGEAQEEAKEDLLLLGLGLPKKDKSQPKMSDKEIISAYTKQLQELKNISKALSGKSDDEIKEIAESEVNKIKADIKAGRITNTITEDLKELSKRAPLFDEIVLPPAPESPLPEKAMSELVVINGATGFSARQSFGDLIDAIEENNEEVAKASRKEAVTTRRFIPFITMSGPAGVTAKTRYRIPILRLHGERRPMSPISICRWLYAYTTGKGRGGVEKNVEAAVRAIEALVDTGKLQPNAELTLIGHSRGAVVTQKIAERLNEWRSTRNLKLTLILNDPVPGGYLPVSKKKELPPNVVKAVVRYSPNEILGYFGTQLFEHKEEVTEFQYLPGPHEAAAGAMISSGLDSYKFALLEDKELLKLGEEEDGALSKKQQDTKDDLETANNEKLELSLLKKADRIRSLVKTLQQTDKYGNIKIYDGAGPLTKLKVNKLWSQGRLELYQGAAEKAKARIINERDGLTTKKNTEQEKVFRHKEIDKYDDKLNKLDRLIDDVNMLNRVIEAQEIKVAQDGRTKEMGAKAYKAAGLAATYLPTGLFKRGKELASEIKQTRKQKKHGLEEEEANKHQEAKKPKTKKPVYSPNSGRVMLRLE